MKIPLILFFAILLVLIILFPINILKIKIYLILYFIIFAVIIISYFIFILYQIKKESYFKKRLETYKGEKVLYQYYTEMGLQGYIYGIILTNKKIYGHGFLPIYYRNWEIEIKKIKNIEYKVPQKLFQKFFFQFFGGPIYYKIKINNKKSYIRSKELDIFLERLKKINKSIIIKGKKLN